VNESIESPKPMTKYLVLLGALIVQLILGTVYGYSIFWEPLQSEIFPRIILEADAAQLQSMGTDVSQFILVADAETAKVELARQQGYLKYAFSICILTFAIVMVVAGRVQDVKGPRFPAIVGAILLGMGFITAGLMRSTIVFYVAHAAAVGAAALVLLMVYHAVFGKTDLDKYPVVRYVPLGIVSAVVVGGVVLGNQYVGRLGQIDRLFLLWGTVGFMAGAGIGFAYVCPIAALVKWFPEHKGLVSGLAVAGFGFGAYLFKGERLGALGFIREHEIIPFFITHGVICLVAVTAGALLLRNPPDYHTKAATSGDSSWQDTLRRPAFYLLWVMFFSGAMAGLMVIGILKPFAGEQLVRAAGVMAGSEEARAMMLKGAAAVGWLAIFNAVGRVAWGFVSDRIGRTVAFIAMFVFQAVIMFMLARMNTELSLAVAASIVGFNFGGNFALFPSATADLFGARNLGANYGWVFTAYGIAGVVGVAAGNTAKVLTGSYSAAFQLAAVLCLVAAVCALVVRKLSNKAATA
jgi:OFA family oxalate/formate antiporter-like MFS transporter